MRAPTGLVEPRVFSSGYMLVNVPHAFKNNVRISLKAHECVGLSIQACASCTHAHVHRTAYTRVTRCAYVCIFTR
eukprot:920470-Pleurochrysis_carterae.AAC.1